MATAKKAVRKPAARKVVKSPRGKLHELVSKSVALKWDEDAEVSLRIRRTAHGVSIGPKSNGANLKWDNNGLVLIFIQRVTNGIKIPIPRPKKFDIGHLANIKIPEPKPKESTR